jgi:hypothetical protein
VSLYGRKIRTLGVAIETRYDSDMPVTAFPGELRQVFSNLIVNAPMRWRNRATSSAFMFSSLSIGRISSKEGCALPFRIMDAESRLRNGRMAGEPFRLGGIRLVADAVRWSRRLMRSVTNPEANDGNNVTQRSCAPKLISMPLFTAQQVSRCDWRLTAIKLLHTVVWALLAGCIVALPVLAFSGSSVGPSS